MHQQLIEASRRLRAEAVELRAQSYALHLRHRARRCPPLSGGSDAGDHDRVKRLLHDFCSDETPKTFAGLSRGSVCQACGSPMKPGELEYEIVTSASSLRLDTACHNLFIESRTDDQDRLVAGG